ncbi:hypothetical protein [Stenotrophomonas sp.]|uniref:hypothetical protein n=1 Tax=Stenotrophomonas sp. TaxID=69392 RepID=UPI0028A15CA4|nr:hypothetical protein [Stenotrophomonas sp.]
MRALLRYSSRPGICAGMLCALLLCFSTAAQDVGPVVGREADVEPLEFPSVAAFVERLPQRKDVEPFGGMPLEPGMQSFHTRREVMLAHPTRESRTWLIFTAEHPLGPSVARVRAYDGAGKASGRRQAFSLMCEGSNDACAALESQQRSAIDQ